MVMTARWFILVKNKEKTMKKVGVFTKRIKLKKQNDKFDECLYNGYDCKIMCICKTQKKNNETSWDLYQMYKIKKTKRQKR